MNTYKITIRPVDTFYFGSEKKFNPADTTESNYLVESLKVPQQTSVLGMLRFALLKRMIKTTNSYQNKEKDLIGENSFDAKSLKYGVIEKLSPVFIEKNGDLYVESGLNYQRYQNKDTKDLYPVQLELTSITGIAKTSVDKSNIVYFFSNYDPKQNLAHYLTIKGAHNTPVSNIIPYDYIIKECQQPGNRKDRTGKTNLEGYYKQTKFRMEEGFSYCVYIQSPENLLDGDFFATLGGDQSLFKIEIKKEKDSNIFPGNPEAKSQKGIVKLISHAFLNTLNNTYFSFLETTDFRYLRTKYGETDSERYASIYTLRDQTWDKTNNQYNPQSLKIPKMSKPIRLVSKGSVFYCEDVESFVKHLNNTAYQAIGYNYYEIIYQ